MGGCCSGAYSRHEIDEFVAITYLNRSEIIHLLDKFKKLAPQQIAANRDYRVPLGLLMEYPEFGSNPFGDRLCIVFSSTGNGSMDFEDFLNCISTFNGKSPVDTIVEYVFQLYDFDGDGMIGYNDVNSTVMRLVGSARIKKLSQSWITELTTTLIKQIDLESVDGVISFSEFKIAASKNLEFHE